MIGDTATGAGTSVPPTASLASLSLGSTPTASTGSAPKNKLAAKMAANKAARAAAAAGAAAAASGTASSSSTRSGVDAALPSASTSDEAPAPEKKLSKLQQKMLAAKAAKAAGQSPVPGAPSTTAALRGPRETARPVDTSVVEATRTAEPDVLPMQLEGLPAAPSKLVAGGGGPDSLFALAAAPSAFAAALTSSVVPAAVPVAARLAASAPEMAAALAVRERFGPSPDDRVLEARKGTALGTAGVPVKRAPIGASAAKVQR